MRQMLKTIMLANTEATCRTMPLVSRSRKARMRLARLLVDGMWELIIVAARTSSASIRLVSL